MRHVSGRALAGALLLAATLLVAAGCGGGGSSGTVGATVATPAATGGVAATTSSGATLGPDAFAACAQLADVGTQFSDAFTGVTTPQDIQETSQALQKLTDQVPAEIRPDFEVVSDAFSKIADAFDSGSKTQALKDLQQQIDMQQVSQSAENIASWLQENCHP